MSALSRRLTWVPPEGIRLPGGTQVPADAARLRQALHFPADGRSTPRRVGFTTGVAFGTWGLAAEDVERLTLLARELTEHITAQAVSDRVIVVSDYADGHATITVIALQGYACGDLDPCGLTHVETHDETGAAQHGMGPSAYVRVRAVRL
ncbi:hypothetical protein ACIGW7_38180 [Streptomyces sp. NPDC053253]|uniref:hypothetical protein n=1 Tax=Streptomyces sp. NPDC053253 TaxID=3365699 RepID=UPI0037D7E60E